MFKVFWQLIISNKSRITIDISRIKMHYNIFLKNFSNKFILVNEIGKILYLNLKYKKKDLGF